MTTDRQDFHEPHLDILGQVPTGLGPPRATFHTAGELATLLARLPADTPVLIAETVRIAEHLDVTNQPHRTVTVAEIVPTSDPDNIIEIDDGERIHHYFDLRLAVQLGTIIDAEHATGLPLITVPLPAHERAVEAMARSETTTALDAQIDLLHWIATTLTTTSSTPVTAPVTDSERKCSMRPTTRLTTRLRRSRSGSTTPTYAPHWPLRPTGYATMPQDPDARRRPAHASRYCRRRPRRLRRAVRRHRDQRPGQAQPAIA